MTDLKTWQEKAHSLAIEKGFHDCRVCEGKGLLPKDSKVKAPCPSCNGTGRCDPHSPTRIASRLALIHCEISEAVECVARGRMELYWVAADGATMPAQPFYFSAQQGESYTNFLRGQGCKPEGFPVELADVFLRTCDLAESLGLTIAHDFDKRHTFTPLHDPEEISAALANLHWEVGGILGLKDVPEVLDGALSWFMRALHQIALATGVDLPATAELKHSFNATRPHRHGGKVL